MLDLYKNIKKYRIESKLTQQELAEKAGYKDKSMIAKIEKGLVDLPQSKIKLFAEIFGMSASELMGNIGPDAYMLNISGETEIQIDIDRSRKIKPGVNIVDRNGNIKTFDMSSLIYTIMESVSNMPPEQQEMVNNMVGGNNRPKRTIYVENPQNKKQTAKKHSGKIIEGHFTNVKDALAYIQKEAGMVASFNGQTDKTEVIIQMANAIYQNRTKE